MYRAALFIALGSLVCLPLATRAETCMPISVVGGQGSEVTKTVSPPTIPGPFGITISHNNWNTDWAVPGDRYFQRFIATITAEKGGEFDIRMYLKYSDQTADESYNVQAYQLEPQQPLTIKGMPRPNNQPYQINLFVGGLKATDKTYKASVQGCF